jgi:hypothetical protein
MELSVTQGLVHVEDISVISKTEDAVIYEIGTREKYPEVISWNSDSLTLLPRNFEWEAVTPADFTLVRFPEKKNHLAAYQENKYSVYFIQFKNNASEMIWEDNG